jgi:4-oxalocrotonate tautomerase family enzyme
MFRALEAYSDYTPYIKQRMPMAGRGVRIWAKNGIEDIRVAILTTSIGSIGRVPMPVIQIDLREGLTDDQKRLAKKVIKAVSEGVGAPSEHIHLVIRESRGINFVFGGEHVPEFEAPKAARAS